MTLVRFNPNRVLAQVDRDFDAMSDLFFRAPAFLGCPECDFVPRVDIAEDKDSVAVHVDLPGMEKDQIKVVVQDGILTISGERKEESEKQEKNYIRAERVYGKFSRSFTLPENVDSEKISADYKNGLLSVVLAKTEKSKPKEITVDIK